jgi:hypothetical protein
LPRVSGFAEGFLSGPRQRISLPRAALCTEVLTTLHPLPTAGPSAGRDPRQNHLFAESQPSARRAPSEKERTPSHLVAVHCADGSAVRLSAQMPLVPRASSSALGKGVDPGLPRLTDLCREPARAVGREDVCADGPLSAQGLCRGPHQALGKEVIFFSFWVELISLLKVP